MHAKQLVDGRDRRQLERRSKYITRPPIAQESLEQRADGRLVLRLKNVWKDGTRALGFEPHDLLTRLVAAVAPPKFHLLRYVGVLSGHVRLRSEVVPEPPADDSIGPPPRQLDLFETNKEVQLVRKPWAWLLKHVWLEDLSVCPNCQGPMRWLEVATNPDDIARLLARHGLADPPATRPRAPPRGQLTLAFARP